MSEAKRDQVAEAVAEIVKTHLDTGDRVTVQMPTTGLRLTVGEVQLEVGKEGLGAFMAQITEGSIADRAFSAVEHAVVSDTQGKGARTLMLKSAVEALLGFVPLLVEAINKKNKAEEQAVSCDCDEGEAEAEEGSHESDR